MIKSIHTRLHNGREQRRGPASRWFLFLGLGLLYVLGVSSGAVSLEHKATIPVLLFTLITILHIGLYWINFSRIVSYSWKLWPLFYFSIQGMLVMMISLIVAEDWLVVVGFYFVLIGQAFVSLQRIRFVLLIIVSYLALFVLSVGLQAGWNWGSFRIPLVAAFPMTLFVVGYSQMYARERLQTLLLELEDTHAQVIDYAEQVEELTLTAERQRLARDLHDTLAQGLTGLVIQLEVVDSQLANHAPERARVLVREMMVTARSTLAEARRAIHDLRTDIARPQDLSHTVQEEIRRFTQATGIPCTADLASLALIPEPLYEHVLRMITEALANVVRHARASQVWLSATLCESLLTIEVRDNGIGFAPDALTQPAGHYGLLGLRERARLARGQLEIKSKPGQGTTLRLSIPVQKSGESDE